MNDEKITLPVIASLIEQNADYVISHMYRFVKDSDLTKLSPSQMNQLRQIFDAAPNYDELGKKVTAWSEKQAAKKNHEDWEKIKGSFIEVVFNWPQSQPALKNLSALAAKDLGENHLITLDIPRQTKPESGHFNDIQFQLTKKAFYAMFKIYRTLTSLKDIGQPVTSVYDIVFVDPPDWTAQTFAVKDPR